MTEPVAHISVYITDQALFRQLLMTMARLDLSLNDALINAIRLWVEHHGGHHE